MVPFCVSAPMAPRACLSQVTALASPLAASLIWKRVMDWLSRAAVIIAAIAAAVQASAAVVVARLTKRLERVTERYANSTDEAVRVSRDQFQREWRPDLRIADVQMYGNGQV